MVFGSKNQRGKTGYGTPRYLMAIVLAFLGIVSYPARSTASELTKETLAGWESYIRSTCSRAEVRAKGSPFLRITELPEKSFRVQAGEALVWNAGAAQDTKVPHGLIHDWMGAVFIPKAAIADVLAVARDYDHYAAIYYPAVIEARRLMSGRDIDRFSMLLMQKVAFVTAALRGEYETQYVQVNARQWYSISKSTRLQSIENYGQPTMQVLPADLGPGYLWRLLSITRFEERDGGVYIELEALGLSRDVPRLLRWLVDPIVEYLPRNSVHTSLEETRSAVLARLNPQD